ncbi:hypothetical protein HY489_05590 [Candidatus Woesearchaeota archaeon]|nr:hypothetical protein [Candidatus Woesearchaeota archaeon]
MINMNVLARIENVEYEPLLCRDLPIVSLKEFENGKAFANASFVIDFKEGKIAVSHWVSAKRTRSYPFARVYDTMTYKTRVTIIPLVKDEGKDGDRDYLQWDTVSLMSLLGVYVIIAYYKKAKKSEEYENKITDQEFDYKYLKEKLQELLNYKSDALHWNLKQLSEINKISKKSENAYYKQISKKCGVELHGIESFRERIQQITQDVEKFKEFSRELAKKAQKRESLTTQPKERIVNEKGTITITNYLGGAYYFTVDEIVISKKKLFLIEKKHSHTSIPSLADIQDGLIKMILYTNIAEARIAGQQYDVKPVLGLTTDHFNGFCKNATELKNFTKQLGKSDFAMLLALFKEAEKNDFSVFFMSTKDEGLQQEALEQL